MASWFVLLLVFSPIEIPVPHRASEAYWQALKEAADRLEVWSVRGVWVTDFASELRFVRRHLRDAWCFPPLADCEQLPSMALAERALVANDRYQSYIEARRLCCSWWADECEDRLADARRRYRAWKAIREARSDDLSFYARREALARLRDLIGDEAYQEGRWPSPIPLEGCP